MKTSMQKLIHDFKHGKFSLLANSKIESELEKYLELEKQQIVDARENGRQAEYEHHFIHEQFQENNITSEQYYNNLKNKSV